MRSLPLLPPTRSATLLLTRNILIVFQAMKAWNEHKAKNGEQVNHAKAKEFLCVHAYQYGAQRLTWDQGCCRWCFHRPHD